MKIVLTALIPLVLTIFAQAPIPTTATPNTVVASAKQVKPPAPAVKQVCNGLGPQSNWDEVAQFVAGSSVKIYESALSEKQLAAWSGYVTAANADWSGLNSKYLDRVAAWRPNAQLDKVTGGAAFYPFSGPDAANVVTFFPAADEYVLVGLEPVGCLPATAADYSPAYFADLRRSLQSAVGVGFFRTNDMRRDFSESRVSGVLPLLLLELSRTGHTITDVRPIQIAKDGLLAEGHAAPNDAEGVAIQFQSPNHPSRTLRYFSLNLHNDPISKTPGALRYLQALPVNGAMVKSASYLMHKRYFSTIRGLILDKAKTLVQDDSGIPFHFFDATWETKLYGTYSSPIPMFANWTQPELVSAFHTRKDVEAIDFGMGYKYKPGGANLMIARRHGQ